MLGILRDCDRLGSRSLPSQSLMEENWQETSGRGIGLGKKFELKIKRLGDGNGNQSARIFLMDFGRSVLVIIGKGDESRNEEART